MTLSSVKLTVKVKKDTVLIFKDTLLLKKIKTLGMRRYIIH